MPQVRQTGLLQRWMPLCVLSISLLSVLLWWWRQGQPSPIYQGVITREVANQLRCVSYAPFRRSGSSPFRAEFNVSKTDIEEDLRLVKRISNCVRTYGISTGLDQVPQVARELGMTVRLGAWLGRDSKDNQRELATAIALTETHADVIELLIVGNEVLLRKELLPNEIIALLKQAKAQTSTPITYADVWEFWRANPQLASHVDSIAIHVLPYWEDEPVAAPQAVEHVFKTFAEMQLIFPNKSLWIAETGWPAAGRQRRGAVPDAATQTRFIGEVVERARREKIDVNIIEAFDQPWKRSLEGAMGGAWGMLDANGNERIQIKSPDKLTYVRDTTWWRGWLGSLLGGTAIGLGLAFHFRLQSFDKVFCILCGAMIGALIPAQFDFIMLWTRTPDETILAVGNALIVIAGSISLILLGSNKTSSRAIYAAQICWITMLFTTAAAAIVLVADPRYRGFALALYCLPAIVSIASCTRLRFSGQFEHAKFLAFMLAIAAVVMLIQEKIDNTQAVMLCIYWLCVTSPVWVAAFAARIATMPANKSAIEQSSAE
jgi:exo-beta-1,3-glucanase (GH17 family)